MQSVRTAYVRMVGPAPSRGADIGVAALDGGWPAVEVSPDGKIVAANDAFARCLGRSAAALRGASFIELVHAEDRPCAVALATAAQPVELRLVDTAGTSASFSSPRCTRLRTFCCAVT